MPDISIRSGKIIIYRLFDIASEIKLSLIESRAKDGAARRLKLSREPYSKALEMMNPPLSIDLKGFTRVLFERDSEVAVSARAYDFGVLSVAFRVPVPEGTAFEDLEKAARTIEEDPSINELAREYAAGVVAEFSPAFVSPEIKGFFIEDYTVFFIERLSEELSAPVFLKAYDPSRLLLGEVRPVSPHIIEETLRNRFSYYPDDLVIIHLDNAFIIDPSGSTDILDILEFSNAQLLELRYYDHVLDRELNWIYSELSRRGGVSIFKLRDYERLAKKITETVTDLTKVTEQVNNALKVTEDAYYARVYRAAMDMFRSRDWEESIKEKLSIVTNNYRMLYNEISTKRGHLLELTIILLIVLEIILAIFVR